MYPSIRSIHFLFSADSTSIGRFDPSMLTDRELMQLFFTPDESDPQNYYRYGDIDDACT